MKLKVKHLDHGSHGSSDKGMCLMEAVAYVSGEPFSDHPQCACPVLAAFCRNLNDSLSDDARQALLPYVKRLVGTRSTTDVERRRAFIAADFAVRVCAADALQVEGQLDQAQKLRSLAPIVDRPSANAARVAADAAAYAANYAANYAARVAADAAAYAANAAAYAARVAADAAAYAANAAAYAAADARPDYLLRAGRHILDAMLSVME